MPRFHGYTDAATGQYVEMPFTAEEEAAADALETAAAAAANDPANLPLTMRQLRHGLRQYAGKPASFIQDVIDTITDQNQKDDAQIWYEETTTVHWEHEMTQMLITLSGIPADDARALWVQTAKNIAA